MRSGLMRDYITIERNMPTKGDFGEDIDNWVELFKTWAYIRGSVSNEQEAIYNIRIRFRELTHNDRIVFGSRIFNITSVLDKSGMGRELFLEGRELV